MTASSPRHREPDFLGRLVDQALGRDDALQPRLRSLFEPVPGTAVATGLGGQDEIAAPLAEESAAPPAVSDPDDMLQRNAARPAKTETDAGDKADAREPLRRAPHIAQGADGVLRAAPRLTRTGAPGEVATPNLPRPPWTATTPKSTRGMSRVLPARDETNALGESRREAPRATVTPAEHPVAPAKAVAARRPPTQRIVVEPATAPHRPAGEPLPVAADQAPVINVTIGRVEVRAVPTPSSPAPRRPEARGPRPMTLDEYLKQRGGGQ
jgi:hypothetical protein